MIEVAHGGRSVAAVAVCELFYHNQPDLSPVVEILFRVHHPCREDLMVSEVTVLSHLGDSFRVGSWMFVVAPGETATFCELKAIHEVDGRFFFTCAKYDGEVTGLTTRLPFPLVARGVSVIALEEVLIQPVDYEVEPSGQSALVSLVV